MPIGSPQISLELFNHIHSEADAYYGRNRPDQHPAPAQLRQQRIVNRWLESWSGALWQLVVLAYQYLSPQELAGILGKPSQLTADQVRRHAFTFRFDVRSLDADWFESLMKIINQYILSEDAGGRIDRSKLVEWAMSYVSPVLAQDVLMDQEGASQATLNQVRGEIAQMALGNEALYTKNDPTAAIKFQMAQKIIASNDLYKTMLQSEPRFRALMAKYEESLNQSIVQQQNKLVGQYGVMPGPVQQQQPA